MARDRFDRAFDAVLAGVVDGVSGGRVDRLRRFARDVVQPVIVLRPFAASTLREVADRLDPPAKRGKMKRGRLQRPKQRE
jgi:hypothetical protein